MANINVWKMSICPHGGDHCDNRCGHGHAHCESGGDLYHLCYVPSPDLCHALSLSPSAFPSPYHCPYPFPFPYLSLYLYSLVGSFFFRRVRPLLFHLIVALIICLTMKRPDPIVRSDSRSHHWRVAAVRVCGV